MENSYYNALRTRKFYEKVYTKHPSLKKYSKKEVATVVRTWVEEAIDIAVTNTDGLNINRNLGTVFLGKSKYNKKIKRPIKVQQFMEEQGLHLHPALMDYIMKVYFTTSVTGVGIATLPIWKFKGSKILTSRAFWHFVDNYEKIMEINPKLKINAAFSVKIKSKSKSTEEMLGDDFDEFDI